MAAVQQLVRAASHASSWYSGDAAELRQQMRHWIANVSRLGHGSNTAEYVKAIICPHAGFSYSGPVAAYSWAHVIPTDIDRVVVLGPSHHAYTRTCFLPSKGVVAYATPLGDIPLDLEFIEDLRRKHEDFFDTYSLRGEEAEHSIELHLPFIRHVLERRNIRLVPIIVGSPSESSIARLAKLLKPLFQDKSTLFVVSSDFCHWGHRFDYSPFARESREPNVPPIHERIADMDLQGASLIEKHDLSGFERYLESTKNTICGRFPIRVLLELISMSPELSLSTRLLHYAQSSQVKSPRDSSVSYATFVTKAPQAVVL